MNQSFMVIQSLTFFFIWPDLCIDHFTRNCRDFDHYNSLLQVLLLERALINILTYYSIKINISVSDKNKTCLDKASIHIRLSKQKIFILIKELNCLCQNYLLMKAKHRKSIKLPQVNEKNLSYALRSIDIASKGCYKQNRQLRIDEGYGDYNMRLFRFKERKKYIKSVPSAFTPSIQRLLQYNTTDPRQKRIATQHNQQIQRILNEPKEVYLQMIRQEREIVEQRRLQEMRRREFVKGQDKEVREYNDQLSFNYLPKHEAKQWFKVIDNSHTYAPSPFSFNVSAVSFTTSPTKTRKNRGHIFLSDDKTRNSLFKR